MVVEYRAEEGVVKEVQDGRALIQVNPRNPEACGSCCACSMWGNKNPELSVRDDGFRTGQKVTVKIPVTSRLLSIGLLFLSPVAGFTIGAVAGSAIKVEGIDRSAISAIGAILGFFVAVGFAVYANRKLASKHPIVVETRQDDAPET